MALAESLIGLFVPIYLYQLGYSIQAILGFYVLVSLFFALLAYSGARLIPFLGIKKAFLWSTPFLIIFYLGLQYLEFYPWLFYLLPLFLTGRMILYNYSYHLNYLLHSESKYRGRELSFIATISVVLHFLAPLVGGILASRSFSLLYPVGAVILLLGMIPLFLTREKYERITFNPVGLWKHIFQKKGYILSFSGYAVESAVGRILWPLFLFLLVGGLVRTGLLSTLSMGFSLAVFYFVGNLTDSYNRVKLLRLGTIFYFFGWVARFFADTAVRVFFIDSYKNLTEKALYIPVAARSYDLAQQQNYYQFIVAREIVFNLARVIILPLLMLFFYFDFHPFLLSFAVAALFSIGYLFLD